ncbi:MAG: hypothetical protein HYV02_05965 [Deltaproteobacteria bacterium]|nr:hypothetical protein [Deltaproteobacteria bacterium]
MDTSKKVIPLIAGIEQLLSVQDIRRNHMPKKSTKTTQSRAKSPKKLPRRSRKKPPVERTGERLEQWVNQLQGTAEDWVAFASMQRARVLREVRDLCEEIVERIAAVPIFAHRDDLIKEARHCLDGLVQRLNTTVLIDKALDSARHTRKELLSLLSIPTQRELKTLQQKLNRIESRLGDLQQEAVEKKARRSEATPPRSSSIE